MPKKRPCVLSIAGFDPSGGAGVLADIKTFEQHNVLGMGLVTGMTFQNDSEFDGVKWIETDEIIEQMEVLLRKFQFEFVKIGMIKNLDILSTLISRLLRRSPPGPTPVKIIWDPIVKASAGFEIHKGFEKEKLISILKKIFLVTPNMDEIKILTEEQGGMKGAKELSKYCNVFLKGGQISMAEAREQQVAVPLGMADEKQPKLGRDYLFTMDGKIFPYRAKKISQADKHGSGCVLSSAIVANLAKGETLQRSCLKGKDYITKFLMSNKMLLGFHKGI